MRGIMTKLRYVLKMKGYSGKTFAAACGLGRSMIYKYMCGSRPISHKTALRFAKVLGVEPEELMGEA